MNCHECGAHIEIWGCVALCDRCLKARLWDHLQSDDHVILRRVGDCWHLDTPRGFENLTLTRRDPMEETVAAVDKLLGSWHP